MFKTLVSLIARAAPVLVAVTAPAVHAAAADDSTVTVAALSVPIARNADADAETDPYAIAVQQRVRGRAHYPNSREARQLRPEGTATVWLELDGSGRLLGSGLSQSSHSPLLDADALQTVRATRFPAFGPAGERRAFVLPIEFVAEGRR